MSGNETSLNGISQSDYAQRTRALLHLVNQLRSMGAQSELDLPRIVVIGNQSAGKSSLVEAISAIKVPRNSSTTTRCPMEVRLSSSDLASWSCRISIRWEYDTNNRKKDQASEVLFRDVKSPELVESVLCIAQSVVLNPHVDMNLLAPLDSIDQVEKLIRESGTPPLDFSRNVICVDIVGPDLADLSFIDLPGLVHNASPKVVKLVEDMIVSHISGNSIILVTLPMSDDLENQKAMRLAQQCDPQGQRTIGVLTKPDILTKGSRARHFWLDTIEGRKAELLHGYYCTKQPDDTARETLDSESLRKDEESFFATTEPWSTSIRPDRFGIPALVNTLSRLLDETIQQSLGKIISDCQERLRACSDELESIPPALQADPASIMLSLITSCVTDFDSHVFGGQGVEAFIQSNISVFREFRDAIRSSVPVFLPFQKEDSGAISFKELHYPSCVGRVHTLDDMKLHLRQALTRELPGHVPFPAKVSLVQGYQQLWISHAQRCLDLVESHTFQSFKRCASTHFKRWEQLNSIVCTVAHGLVREHAKKCLASISLMLEAERTPYTQNTDELARSKENWLTTFKNARAPSPPETNVNPTPKIDTIQPLVSPQKIRDGSKANPTTKKKKRTSKKSGKRSIATYKVVDEDDEVQPIRRPPYVAPMVGDESFMYWFAFHQASCEEDRVVFYFEEAKRKKEKKKATLKAGEANLERDDSSEEEEAVEDSKNEAATPDSSSTPPIIPPVHPSDKNETEKVLALLMKAGIPGLTIDDIAKLKPVDQYEEEMSIMAEVRAYFDLSSQRVVDYIPMLIDQQVVRGISEDLKLALLSRFSLGLSGASEKCARYLGEDRNIVSRRSSLVTQKQRLQKAYEELSGFDFLTEF